MKLRLAAVGVLALACTEDPPLDVAKVDLERFSGGWYEIAKLPRATQSGCTGTVAVYRLNSESELDVYSECHEGALDGPVRRMAARAVVTDPDEPAKLSLDFGGFFGDYWIVNIDPDYRYAAIGHPSRDYLWILARSPAIPESDYTELAERVRAKGFDVNRLERTLQAPDGESNLPPKESIPPPKEYGCSRRLRAFAFGARLVRRALARRFRCANQEASMTPRTVLRITLSLGALLSPGIALASETYPVVVFQIYKTPSEPECTLCHSTIKGGDNTITTKFGKNLEARGARGKDTGTLGTVLAEAANARQDSDEDGATDLKELQRRNRPEPRRRRDNRCGWWWRRRRARPREPRRTPAIAGARLRDERILK